MNSEISEVEQAFDYLVDRVGALNSRPGLESLDAVWTVLAFLSKQSDDAVRALIDYVRGD